MINLPPHEIDRILESIAYRNPKVVLEARRQEWVRNVCGVKPGVSLEACNRVSNLIIREAFRIGQMSPIDPQMLAPYFLTVTLKWILEGRVMDMDTLMDRLPKDPSGVGTMVVAEQINPLTGKRLTAADLKAAQEGGKLILQ